MSIEKLFFEKFKHYEAAPPSNMWSKIAAAIERDKDKAAPYFSAVEKRFIAISVLTMALSSGLLMQYISSPHLISQETIEYTAPNAYSAADLRTENLPIATKAQENDPVSSLMTSGSITRTNSSHSSSKANGFSEEELAMINESKNNIRLVHDLTRLDKQIDSIEKIQWDEAKALANIPPSVIQMEEKSLTTSDAIESSTRFITESPKNEPLETEKSKLFNHKGVYLTPYIGGNFTSISYQSQPNNPYFSDKAVFISKIGYNFGLQAGYQFNKHWSIESGIAFGQYIQSFRETLNQTERRGQMYIDQIDIPLTGRFSINFGDEEYPKSFSFKSGVIYNSVTQYQVNFRDKNLVTRQETDYKIDADKRLYNSLQLGYLLGFDFDAFISKKISLNLSMLNALVSQFDNFPLFKSDIHRPIQYSTTFTIGTKIRF